MIIETNVPLQPHNSFGIAARAERLLRLRTMDDVQALLADPLRLEPHFVLGGGSNIVITGDIKRLVIKVELMASSWCLKMTKPGSFKPLRAKTGMTLWLGPWRKAGLAWKTWP